MADFTSFSEIFLHFICFLACRLNDIFIFNDSNTLGHRGTTEAFCQGYHKQMISSLLKFLDAFLPTISSHRMYNMLACFLTPFKNSFSNIAFISRQKLPPSYTIWPCHREAWTVYRVTLYMEVRVRKYDLHAIPLRLPFECENPKRLKISYVCSK